MTRAQTGDRVQVHFTGRLEDGAVFVDSQGKAPVPFVVGAGEMLDGISHAVVGMGVGEKKTVTFPPEQGFGPRHPDEQRQVPRAALPADVRVGDQLVAQGGGRQERLWLRDLGEDVATLDANHPLAGLTLTFDIELVSIQPSEQAP